MMPEIIDLTNSSPSPPRSSNASIVLGSTRQVKFENAHFPLIVGTNPNLSQASQQQIVTPWPTFDQTNVPSQIVTSFQPSMQGGIVTTEPNKYLVPHGAMLNEPWTQRDHELFVMGLIRYGKGRWTKIAKDFLRNKTPQQVQSYAANFMQQVPPPFPHEFGRRTPTYSSPHFMSNDWNLIIDPSIPNSVPVVVNNRSQQLFTLVPMTDRFLLDPPNGEASTSTNNNTNTIKYGFQMHTGDVVASTSMNVTPSANEDIDLELRLGPRH
ncbi:uncharacterized protein LOC109806974 [Cajanus cajan]|uniref:uncharacterized protein LOC109806974 n=1 Tax=Cajanus cajan TaxID=3821 RepID=UPI00098DD491|nr:uncharacterized protein LOC109806974 [Cajanus cajan]